MYFEEHGNPEGIPALYLHGGPGGGLGKRGWTQLFDPAVWRLVGMDQRGCGQSTPHASEPDYDFSSNTIAALIDDIEALRIELGIAQWVFYGVSWGTTLALAYARAFPHRVRSMVLLALTTTSRWEVEWISQNVATVFPEAHFALEQAVSRLEAEVAALERILRKGEPAVDVDGLRFIERVARLVAYPDASVRERAIDAWLAWEDSHVSLGKEKSDAEEQPDRGGEGGVAGARKGEAPRRNGVEGRSHRYPGGTTLSSQDFAILTTHYWAHDAFLEVPLLRDLGGAAEIETEIIHGRMDVSGPLGTAWRLSRLMPNSRLTVVETEGHGGPTMIAHAAAALERLAQSDGPRQAGTPTIIEH
ncbi:alpha/beta fold hydrolase [Arcanobacterium wilhelmae]|uniref:alpha/beta fold hydrolase n=1 Tax=Arcanobacterium wilhelmae TaxID=1803177 RepID=UPI0024153088|nr:alpha/beta fold hydrolase [Arcanobacterium wilhelmae]WFN90660.1 alpha/beta fold hydrolase [Arcanobacterium wilhelmae]